MASIAIAAIPAGGLSGVKHQMPPPHAELDKLAEGLPGSYARLPAGITTAADALANGNLCAVELGADFIDHRGQTRKNEWPACHTGDAGTPSGPTPNRSPDQVSEWEYRRCVELV